MYQNMLKKNYQQNFIGTIFKIQSNIYIIIKYKKNWSELKTFFGSYTLITRLYYFVIFLILPIIWSKIWPSASDRLFLFMNRSKVLVDIWLVSRFVGALTAVEKAQIVAHVIYVRLRVLAFVVNFVTLPAHVFKRRKAFFAIGIFDPFYFNTRRATSWTVEEHQRFVCKRNVNELEKMWF